MKRWTERNIVKTGIAERPVRKAVRLPVQVLTECGRYSGFIVNTSTFGVGMYIDTDVHESTIDCAQGTVISLEFTSQSEDIVTLHCRIRWLRIKPHPPHGLTTSMGMEVINPPSSFRELINSLP